MDEPAPEASKYDAASVPLVAERAVVSKRRVESGVVSVSVSTTEHKQIIDETLRNEHAEIERVSIDKFVDAMPEVREEGEIIIVPVVEEILVVERRLLLKQEVWIRKTTSVKRHRETVMLRSQEADISREPIVRDDKPT